MWQHRSFILSEIVRLEVTACQWHIGIALRQLLMHSLQARHIADRTAAADDGDEVYVAEPEAKGIERKRSMQVKADEHVGQACTNQADVLVQDPVNWLRYGRCHPPLGLHT